MRATINRARRMSHPQQYSSSLHIIRTWMVLLLVATPIRAQRVEFPTAVQPVQSTSPYTVAPSPYAVPSTPAPYVAPADSYPVAPPTYSAPGTVAPPAVSPYTPPSYSAPAAPAYSPAAVGPPPAFDPYASGGSVAGTPPVAAPYNYTPQPVPFGAPPAPVLPNPPPYQPPPYDIQPSGEGYWQKTQRLLQEISVEYTLIGGNDFGLDRLELSSTFAFPMFGNIDTPLLVTPGFAFNWLDGPMSGPPIPGPPVMAGGPDLPPRVYDAYLDFAWYPHCYEWLGGELGFRTGVWSDFDHVTSDSVRFLGRALASVAIAPTLDVRFGVVYLDRVDVKILPAGGFYWRPTPDWDIYAVFPNPKIRKFLTAIGNTKWYGYAAGEYGGDSWTVARQTTNDQIDYNDIRVIGGLEWETQTMIRGHIELGYVFNREIVFVSRDPPSFSPDNTFMLRAGVSF
jgi:hypothetical protein